MAPLKFENVYVFEKPNIKLPLPIHKHYINDFSW